MAECFHVLASRLVGVGAGDTISESQALPSTKYAPHPRAQREALDILTYRKPAAKTTRDPPKCRR